MPGRPLPRRWRRIVGAVVATALAATLVVAALHADGFTATALDLHDAGIWVTRLRDKSIGRVNTEIEQVDTKLAIAKADDSLDVHQVDGTVLVRSGTKLRAVDVRYASLVAESDVPAQSQVFLGGTHVAVFDDESGKLWIGDRDLVGAGNITGAAPTAEVEPRSAVAVGRDGTVHVYQPKAGSIRRYTSATAWTEEAAPTGLDGAAITAVGATPVLLAKDGEVHLPGGVRTALDDDGEELRIQQPGPEHDAVLVAGDRRLVSVPLDGGSPRVLSEEGTGAPVEPVYLRGCAYAAWQGDARGAQLCAGRPAAVQPLGFGRRSLRFRVNRDRVLLNDVESGSVLLFGDGDPKRIDDWNQALDPSEEETDDEREETRDGETPDRPEENRPPVANDDEAGTRPGRPVVVPVVANDNDPDGDVLVASLPEPLRPEDGSLAVVADGSAVQFTPAPSAGPATTFPYAISDGRGGSAQARVTVAMRRDDENGAPRPTGDTATVEAGKSVTFNVLLNDVDPDGDPLSLRGVEAAGELGTAQHQPDGWVTYTAPATPGSKEIPYVVGDDRDEVATGTITVTVKASGENSPPQANNDFVRTVRNREVAVDLLANDRDANGDPLSVAQVSEDAEAQVHWTPDGRLRFRSDVARTHLLEYTVTDGRATGKAVLRIDVEAGGGTHPPVAVRDEVAVRPGVPAHLDVLANDFDLDGDVLVVQRIAVPPSAGVIVELLDHHVLRIVAAASFTRPVTVTYVVSDGSAQATGVAVISRAPSDTTNQPPTAARDEITIRAGNVTAIPVLRNDSDPERDPLQVVGARLAADDGTVGKLFVQGDELRYRAPDEERGTIVAHYTIEDLARNRVDGELLIHVTSRDLAQNRPPVAPTLSARVLAGRQVVIDVPIVGSDPDGDTVALLGVGDPPKLGQVLESTGNRMVYAADRGSRGTDTFTYRLRDQHGAEATGTVLVGVAQPSEVNTAPVAVPDTVSVAVGDERRIAVLRNDRDLDDDPITLLGGGEGPTAPRFGTLRVDGDVLVYRAPDAVPGGAASAEVSLDYGITDGRGATARGPVTITVTAQREPVPPVARDDVLPPAVPGSVVDADVLANDDDPDGDVGALRIEVEGLPGATVVDGRIRFTMGDRPLGFVYKVTDPDGRSAEALVQVPLSQDRPPVAVADVAETDLDRPVDVRVLANDRDPDGGALTLVRAREPRNGSVEVTGDVVRFTPAAGFTGQGGFAYEVSDGTTTVVGAASVVVRGGGNAPPTMVALDVEVPAGGERRVDLAAAVTDPNPEDRPTFDALEGAIEGVTGRLDGSSLVVTAADAARGRSGRMTVRASDGRGGEVVGAINVVVSASEKAAPSAVDDTGATLQEKPLTLRVLDNDIDPAGKGLTIAGVNAPAGGAWSAAVAGDTIVFTPGGGFFGVAEFSYVIGDATGDAARQASATVRVTVTGRPSAPPAPIVESVVSHVVTLRWGVPANNGAPITAYEVESRDGSVRQSCPTNTCPVGGLENGRPYEFRVRSINEAGPSDWSPYSPEQIPDELPPAPNAPTVRFGDKKIDVSWSLPAVDGTPISEVLLWISVPGADGAATQRLPGGATSYSWGSLTNGQAYSFRVSVRNGKGEGPLSPPSIAEIPAGAPIGLRSPTATRGDGRVNVRFPVPNGSSNGAPIDAYKVQARQGTAVVAEQNVPDATAPDVWFAGLANGTGYTFRVQAHNKAGWSDWGPDSDSIVPAGAPAAVSVSGRTELDRAVQLTFTEPSDNGAKITSYRYRATNAGGGVVTADAELPADKVVRNLTNGETYRFEVRACNGAVQASPCGPYSSPTPDAVPFGVPAAPGVSGSTNGTTLTWSWNVPFDNGRPLMRFDVYLDGTLVAQDMTTSFSRGFGHSETHTVRVVAINQAGAGAPGEAGARTVDRPSWGFNVQDDFMGGTWARTDPNNGTWYSSGNRPPNGAYWAGNGQAVRVVCTSSRAAYTVKFANGSTQTWRWWANLTDGTWIPVAAFQQFYSDGGQGLPGC